MFAYPDPGLNKQQKIRWSSSLNRTMNSISDDETKAPDIARKVYNFQPQAKITRND